MAANVPADPTSAARSVPLSRIPAVRLLRGLGGGRYALAAAVSALGAGLIRPFLLLYAVTISDLSPSHAGLALSAGFVVGLGFVPITGRWVDAGGQRAVLITTSSLQAAGLVLLLVVPGPAGFVGACLLQGIGNQTGTIAQAAMVTSLTVGYERDTVLAGLRSLRNAGLGTGALLATVALGTGAVGMRWLAAATAAGYLISAALISTVPVPKELIAARRRVRDRLGIDPADRPVLRRLAIMNIANLPFALCFDILEVALPVVVVTELSAAPAWSSAIFIVNTVLVIAVQLPMVVWMSRRPRRQVFGIAGAVLSASYLGFLAAGTRHGDTGALAIAAVAVVYTLGEILYTGVGTALVIDAAPARLRGRALARWQFSLGVGRAIAPLAITAALSVSAITLWLPLAAATALGAAVIVRHAPTNAGSCAAARTRGTHRLRRRPRYRRWSPARRERTPERLRS